ncbi:unnamed protein product [Durusdinium trenchii]|uniref:Uncharacterized protein n=1 Tax=Durusdinium trenchii TaxID=1381693 RepID=A0ABP0SUA2_9DINO
MQGDTFLQRGVRCFDTPPPRCENTPICENTSVSSLCSAPAIGRPASAEPQREPGIQGLQRAQFHEEHCRFEHFTKKGTLGIQCQSFALNSVPLKVRISQDTSDCRCVEFPLGNPSHWRSVKMGAGSFTSSWNQRYRKAR